MRTFIFSLSILFSSLVAAQNPETLAIGTAAPATEVKMMDISGKEYSLSDLKKPGGLLVVFSCNGCPFVVGSEGSEGWEGRYD
ncbi:MAG: hypothetical protein ACKO7B_05595, partial [Flavobacteriales bacterium]